MDWVEGVAIMVAVIIVVVVGSINDWQKERQFKKLNEKKEDRSVKRPGVTPEKGSQVCCILAVRASIYLYLIPLRCT